MYAARLLKLSHPDADVEVIEQSQPEQTFGFGVGIAAGTQRNLNDADPASLEAIVNASYSHEMSMRVGPNTVHLPQDNLRSIARTTLLEVLNRCATDAGVRMRYGGRGSAADIDADLVIAADGAGSQTREDHKSEFGTTVTDGRSHYLWCGTDFALARAVFSPVHTDHGVFTAHAYPYAPNRSTFLIETDHQTWLNAGFAQTTADVAPADSDTAALGYLQEVFAEELNSHPLIGNRTRWQRFRTVSCTNWSCGNIVLLGDAAHTAHYSIGSGTKLAMEDAIALDRALIQHDDLATALQWYEQTRRPAVEHLQDIARRSASWWDSFPQRLDLPVESLLMSYMTRAGKFSVEKFSRGAPTLTRAAMSLYAGRDASPVADGTLDDWVIDQQITLNGRLFQQRIISADDLDGMYVRHVDVTVTDAWSPEGDALVARSTAGITAQTVLWLSGPPQRSSLLSRLDVAERLRLATGHTTVVEGLPDHRDDLVAGLVSMRTPLAAVAARPHDPASTFESHPVAIMQS
ncbi:FAD-dependent monooxygenase [Mycolicibacterium sp. HS_4_1]